MLNGVRVLSIVYVVYGHVYSTLMVNPAINILTVSQSVRNAWYFSIVPGGYFAVDAFFFLSGLLTFYLITVKLKK